MKPRLCDHERERRRVAGVRRYEPEDIEIPPWPSDKLDQRAEEIRNMVIRDCWPPKIPVADLRDYVRHWPVALGFGVWIFAMTLAWVAFGACVYVGVLGVGALLGAVW